MKYVNIINLMIICGIYTGIEGFFRRSSKIYSTARPFLTRKVGVSRLHTGKKTYSTFSTPTKLDLTRKKSAGLIKELADEQQAVDVTLARIRKQEQTWQKRYHDTRSKLPPLPDYPLSLPPPKPHLALPKPAESKFSLPAPVKPSFLPPPREKLFLPPPKSQELLPRPRSSKLLSLPPPKSTEQYFLPPYKQKPFSLKPNVLHLLKEWKGRTKEFPSTLNKQLKSYFQHAQSRMKSRIQNLPTSAIKSAAGKSLMFGAGAAGGLGLGQWIMNRPERVFTRVENIMLLANTTAQDNALKARIIQNIIDDLSTDNINEYLRLFDKESRTITRTAQSKLFALGMDNLFMKLASLIDTPEQADRLDHILLKYDFMNYNLDKEVQQKILQILAQYNPQNAISVLKFVMEDLIMLDAFDILYEKSADTIFNIIELFPSQSSNIYEELNDPARKVLINKLLESRLDLAEKYIRNIVGHPIKLGGQERLKIIAQDIKPANKEKFSIILQRILPPSSSIWSKLLDIIGWKK